MNEWICEVLRLDDYQNNEIKIQFEFEFERRKAYYIDAIDE